MAAPTFTPAQAPGVTADIEVLSPLNVTDPLLLGKDISIYLDDCCLLAVIDVESLEAQGVDIGLVDILFTPDANWWGTEVIKYIDINSTTSGWITNPETGVNYAIIRSSTDPNIVLLAIDLSSTDLSNVVVHREAFGDIVAMNLYGIPLWLRIRDYNPPSPPDSALSVNRFAVIQPPVIDWDKYIAVRYFIDNTEVSKAKYGTKIDITIKLPDEIKYLLNITGDAPELTFNNVTVFNITMFNLDNPSDRSLLYSNLMMISANKYLESITATLSTDGTVLDITGYVRDFSPLAIHEDASFEPKAFYGFEIYIGFNLTANVGYGLDLSELPPCPNVVNEDTISFTFENLGSTSTVYVEIWSSLEIVTTYPSIMHDTSDLNPGDIVKFKLHNIPVPYNDTSKLYQVVFATAYTTITSTLFDYLAGESNPNDGLLIYNVTLPDGEWGGLTATVTFIFRKVGYEIHVNENPLCYPVTVTVEPYADIYVLLNDPTYIVSQDGMIYRKFAHWSLSDYTAAPGDYILVKGYGFITEGGINVVLNDTIVLRKLLEKNSMDDPSLAPGRVLLVVKVQDAGTLDVICPSTDNKLTIVGALFSTDNSYIPNAYLTIGYREDLLKFLVNPELFYNSVEQTVYVTQKRLGLFDVYYDLVDDPEAPGGDEFIEDTWDTEFKLEIIGVESSSIDLVFKNTYPHYLTFTWDTIPLSCGYANISYTGATIPFLPMGTYTILLNNGTIFVPEAINGSNVFEVHPNLDIDVLPDDDTSGRRCCDVVFNVVGGLPNDILTFYGNAEVKISTDVFGGPTTWRTEPITVDVTTDIYGTGSATVYGLVFYDSTELHSDVKTYMDGHSFTGSGDVLFTIDYNAKLDYFTNGTLIIWHTYWGTGTEKEFLLDVTGTVHYFDIVDEINWTASIKVPRTRIIITVPETVLPGDNITIQIIVHKTNVPHDQVTPEELWDLLYPYWISIRLVDLSASTGGSWVALYGGWLRFDSSTTEIVLPNGKVAKLVRVLEDADGDGVDEIVFLAVIPAPITTYDMTLRVDVNITLAYENTGTPTFLDLVDDECTFEANYTGARMWATEYTYVLYGGDDQLTTVLGLLEAKLDYINGTTVYIKVKVDNISKYITYNLTQLLNDMNNTIIEIKNNTVTISTKLGNINTSLNNLFELIENISKDIEIQINNTETTIIAKLTKVNETLYLKINESSASLKSLINNILKKLNELGTNVTYTIYAVNSSIIRHIDVVADDLRYDILLRIDEAENTLSNLITVKADEIEYFINETTTTIIAKINESTLTITDAIDSAKADLEVYIDGQTATIRSDIAAVKTDTESIIDLVNTLQTSVNNSSVKLVQVNDTIYALVLSVGNDVKATITGKASDILGFLNEFKTTTDTSFSNVLSTINELSTNLEAAKTEILADLSSVYSDLSSKLDDVSSAISSAGTSIEDKVTSAKGELSTKVDTLAGDLKKTVEDKTGAVNSNVTTFSLTLLILIVVLIGLVGYSVIAARRVR